MILIDQIENHLPFPDENQMPDAAEEQQFELTSKFELALEDLDSVVGLADVKTEIRRMAYLMQMGLVRSRNGLKPLTISPHLIFSGNRGTGKKKVAQCVGKIYNEVGVLSKGHVIEARETDLFSGNVDETITKTLEVCNLCIGGILFLSNAFIFKEENREHIEASMRVIADFAKVNEKDIAVIMSGSEIATQVFSRTPLANKLDFANKLKFQDYSPTDLKDLLVKSLLKFDYQITDEALSKVSLLFQRTPSDRDSTNVHRVQDLVKKLASAHAESLQLAETTDIMSLSVITADMVPAPGVLSTNRGIIAGYL